MLFIVYMIYISLYRNNCNIILKLKILQNFYQILYDVVKYNKI